MHKILLALTGAALSAAAVAFPVYANGSGHASGARTADTDTTFTITAGDLTIGAPGSVSLGTVSANVGSFSGHIGPVVVSDTRGGTPNSWTASVQSTDFTSTGGTVAVGDIDYNAGTVTDASCTVTPSPSFALSHSDQTAVTATGCTASNTGTWNPTLTVHLSGQGAGTYSGTVTHSVA